MDKIFENKRGLTLVTSRSLGYKNSFICEFNDVI